MLSLSFLCLVEVAGYGEIVVDNIVTALPDSDYNRAQSV
jgi:hypothetical protein